MALNNENNPTSVVIPIGSPSADAEFPAIYLREKCVILGVTLINGAEIAASNTDYVQLSLQNGSTVIAEIDSRAAHENGIASLVGEPLNLVAAQSVQDAGSTLKIVYNETDSGTAVALTNAVLVLEYYPL